MRRRGLKLDRHAFDFLHDLTTRRIPGQLQICVFQRTPETADSVAVLTNIAAFSLVENVADVFARVAKVFELSNEVLDRLLKKNIIFPEGVVRVDQERVSRHPASSPILTSAESIPQVSPALLSAGWRTIARTLFARPLRCVPEFRAPLFAARQNASGNPEIRDLNRAPSWDQVLFAKSYRADARDAAARHHRAVRRARYSDRSGTSVSPSAQKVMQSSILPRIIRCSEATEESAAEGFVTRRREEIRNVRCVQPHRGGRCAAPRAARARSSGCEHHRQA